MPYHIVLYFVPSHPISDGKRSTQIQKQTLLHTQPSKAGTELQHSQHSQELMVSTDESQWLRWADFQGLWSCTAVASLSALKGRTLRPVLAIAETHHLLTR